MVGIMLSTFLKKAVVSISLSILPFAATAASDTPLQVNSGGAESSTGAASALQPSSAQTLQASGDSGNSVGGQSTGTGATQNGSSLQAPADSQAVSNYLNGELVGGPQGSKPVTQPSSSLLSTSIAALLFLIVAAIVVLYVRRNRKQSRKSFTEQIPKSAQANGDEPSPELAETIEAAVALDSTEVKDRPVAAKTGVEGAGVTPKKLRGSAKKKAKKARKH
jgi:uncharacterized membrane protein